MKDFFEKEISKAQNRFNQTFGDLTVCDLRLRRTIIFSIVSMGRLSDKIVQAKSKDNVRGEIKRFMKTRNILNNLFDQFEKQKEGRDHDCSGDNARKHIRR